jgi:hypothetical protein
MPECDVMKESMPLLLTESLDPAQRERTHQHIEGCAACTEEWLAYQETWSLLTELPEVDVPARVKSAFLAQVMPQPERSNVVPFHRRPAFKWVAQAAAVVVIAGGGYLAGHRNAPGGSVLPPIAANGSANAGSFLPVSTAPTYSIAETRTLPARAISPNIEGRPDIENVNFIDANPQDEEIGVSFDITSHVTVTGRPTDKSMVRLLRYVLENEDHMTPSRQRAIDWVRTTYSRPHNADPEIAEALANVLRNDTHEGVRIKAVDTLKTLPATASGDGDTYKALIEALKNDPNPSVRMKAVEALVNLARSGAVLSNETLDTLRQKASQGDENLYVRVKAAEALKNVHP